MKVNTALIGTGKWGSLIKSRLIKISNLKFAIGKKKNYLKLIKENNLNWVFVATPNKTHFTIVKNCLNLKVNVFCEKPLTLSYIKAEKLLRIAKKNKVKLYVSDIYSFNYNKLKKFLLKNQVFRSKKVVGSDSEFLFRFLYHDVSLLFDFIKDLQIKSIKFKQIRRKKLFNLCINFKNNKSVIFNYNLNKKIKNHFINDINFITRKDALKKMLFSVINRKINIKSNNDKALFILKFLSIIKKRIQL